MKFIRRITHKLILWYTRRVAGGDFHTNPYGPEGRYIVCMTEAQYHRYKHLAQDPTHQPARVPMNTTAP